MRKPKAANVSTLEQFSNIVSQLGEERRAKDLQAAKQAKRDLPEAIRGLKDKTDEELFELYDNAFNSGYSNHQLMRVLIVWKKKIRFEMLRRMQ